MWRFLSDNMITSEEIIFLIHQTVERWNPERGETNDKNAVNSEKVWFGWGKPTCQWDKWA